MKTIPQPVTDEMDIIRRINAIAEKNRNANMRALERQVKQQTFNAMEK